MAEIVNLRNVRKAKARALAGRQAERNRQAFGRSKADKQNAAREAERLKSVVDGAERERE